MARTTVVDDTSIIDYGFGWQSAATMRMPSPHHQSAAAIRVPNPHHQSATAMHIPSLYHQSAAGMPGSFCTAHQDPSDPDPFGFPMLFQVSSAETQYVQPDLRPSVEATHPDSPTIQTFYRWQGIVQLEKTLAIKSKMESRDSTSTMVCMPHTSWRSIPKLGARSEQKLGSAQG